MGLRGAPDVEVDQLVEQHLKDVAAADSRIRGDGEAKLTRHGEAEAIRAPARPPHLELGLAPREWPVGEHRQRPSLLISRSKAIPATTK